MKIINERDINQVTVKGSRGEIYLKNIIASDTIVAGLRTIAPNSEVTARPHKHEDPQIAYVIKGTAMLDNGHEVLEIKTGDCIVFEPWEEHYFTSGKEEVVLFGVKWKE
ncbi:MAG: cupin domain-containing protein [Candidatus Odinarchaeota archaeon]